MLEYNHILNPCDYKMWLYLLLTIKKARLTAWLLRAGNGIRTRDPQLGKIDFENSKFYIV